ncbi:MAG: S8 family serine peptidase [Candidatus Heimdallarchaeaceae archaeon]
MKDKKIMILLLILPLLIGIVPIGFKSNANTMQITVDNGFLFHEVKVSQKKTISIFSERNNDIRRYSSSESAFLCFNDRLDWGVDYIDAEEVWGESENANDVLIDHVAGRQIKIAILDSGIEGTHSDIVVQGGYDFVTNTSWTQGSQCIDEYGHGTAMAGVIRAEDNDVNLIGVAPLAKIYAYRVGIDAPIEDPDDSNQRYVTAAIRQAILDGMDIISMSFSVAYNSDLEQKITQAYNAGILLIAGSGNNLFPDWSSSYGVKYPAAHPKVIAVGAVDNNYERPSFSHYGPNLELVAPGVNVESSYKGNSYVTGSGTSFATAHVAGVCALMMEANPNLSNEEIRLILHDQAEDHDGSGGFDQYYGYGFCNARLSVNEAIWYGEDSDYDSIINGLEKYYYNTNPSDSDTDLDLLPDGAEVNTYSTDPLCSDTDGDTMIDGWEVQVGLNPLSSSDKYGDPDNDGLLNYQEHWVGSNPYDTDSDNDGLSDLYEYEVSDTDLLNIDTDGDGYTDYYELFPPFPYDPSDPNDYNSIPTVGGGGGGGGLF